LSSQIQTTSSKRVQFPAKLQPLFSPCRYKILYGGRGGSKSWGVARALLIIGNQKKIRVLCAREVQKSIKESVHQLLKDQIEVLGLGADYDVLDTEIKNSSTGSKFVFAGLGTMTTESIKSYEGVDIVWVEEGQTVRKRSWQILIPTIRKDDSEIWVTMNPELDTDDTYVRFITNPHPDSVVIEINYQDNPWFPDVLEQERLHCYNTDRESYDNIWEGKCRKSVAGAIYANEIEQAIHNRQIRNIPYDPMLKVHTVWDLGFNDSMTIIMAQRVSSEIRVIDYIEDSHHTLDWYVGKLKELNYNWGQDFLPHDGFYKDYKTGKSANRILEALGRNVAPGTAAQPAVPKMGIEQGIKEARMIFARCYFDQERTERLITCLKRYRRRLNQQTDEPEAPLHDEFSHGADCFRYLALVADEFKNSGDQNIVTHLPPPPDWRAV